MGNLYSSIFYCLKHRISWIISKDANIKNFHDLIVENIIEFVVAAEGEQSGKEIFLPGRYFSKIE